MGTKGAAWLLLSLFCAFALRVFEREFVNVCVNASCVNEPRVLWSDGCEGRGPNVNCTLRCRGLSGPWMADRCGKISCHVSVRPK